jgi:hypothetical protein
LALACIWVPVSLLPFILQPIALASPDYCPTTEPCIRSDLFAFQVSSGLALSFCGILGVYTWHFSKRAHTHLPETAEGRLYGYLKESEQLAAGNFTFQFWDFWISLVIDEHRTAIMLAHHSIAALLSWLSLEYQVLHYYGGTC